MNGKDPIWREERCKAITGELVAIRNKIATLREKSVNLTNEQNRLREELIQIYRMRETK